MPLQTGDTFALADIPDRVSNPPEIDKAQKIANTLDFVRRFEVKYLGQSDDIFRPSTVVVWMRGIETIVSITCASYVVLSPSSRRRSC